MRREFVRILCPAFLILASTIHSGLLGADDPVVVKIVNTLEVPFTQERKLAFDVAADAAVRAMKTDQAAYLIFNARIADVNQNGATNAAYFSVNGTRLDGKRLANKPIELTLKNGMECRWYSTGGPDWFIFYGPNYLGLLNGPKAQEPVSTIDADPYLFVLDVTDLIKPGANEVAFLNNQDIKLNKSVIFGDMVLEIGSRRPPIVTGVPVGTVPTGPLTRIEPQKPGKVDYKINLEPGGGFSLAVGGTVYPFDSKFTFPGGGWNRLAAGARDAASEANWQPVISQPGPGLFRVEASGAHYRLVREIQTSDDHVDIYDTLTNLSQQDLGLWYEHAGLTSGPAKSVWICGQQSLVGWGEESLPETPITYWSNLGSGVGVIPRDDAMRVHSSNFVTKPRPDEPSRFGLHDRRFGIGPGATYKFHWSLFPTRQSDYWEFINTARRLLDANFTVEGSSVYIYARPPFLDMTSDQAAEWCKVRAVKYVTLAMAEFDFDKREVGKMAHGSAMLFTPQWHAFAKERMTTFKAKCPDVRSQIYFHAWCSTEPGAGQKYSDSRLLDITGKQSNYPYGDNLLLFVPTTANSYGKAMRQVIDLLLDGDRVDGIFWDEMSHSSADYTYGGVWDGVSADVNSNDFTVLQRVSHVQLLSAPFVHEMVERITSTGHSLVGNGMPITETEMKMHFPRHTEAASVMRMRETQLFSPVGIGDQMNEKDDASISRQIRKQLDRAGLYYYYVGDIPVTHPNLTTWMFPFTPIEIRPGVMIGKERILISKPGVYGWGDGTVAREIHLFNDQGIEIDSSPWVERDLSVGLTSVRLPEGYTAALIHP